MKARLALLLVALSCAPAVAQNSAQHVTVEQVPFPPGFDLRDAYGDYVIPPDLRERIAQTLGPRVYGVAALVPNDGPPYLEVMMKSPSAADAATVRAMLGDRSYRIVETHYSADEAQALQGQIAKALMANPAMNADMSGLHFDAAHDRFVLGTVSGRTRRMQAFLSARGWASVPFEVIRQSRGVAKRN